MDEAGLIKIKEIFGVSPKARISVTPVKAGWNIRIHKPKLVRKYKSNGNEMSFRDKMEDDCINMNKCLKCGEEEYCHPHHIIPKSAGGQDESDNGLPLCFDCHVGDNGIHQGKWVITDVVPQSVVNGLKRRYSKV